MVTWTVVISTPQGMGDTEIRVKFLALVGFMTHLRGMKLWSQGYVSHMYAYVCIYTHMYIDHHRTYLLLSFYFMWVMQWMICDVLYSVYPLCGFILLPWLWEIVYIVRSSHRLVSSVVIILPVSRTSSVLTVLNSSLPFMPSFTFTERSFYSFIVLYWLWEISSDIHVTKVSHVIRGLKLYMK